MISWNKYRFEITTQLRSNKLAYMIDLTFRNSDMLLVLSLIASENDPTRNFFDKYCMPFVEIKDFNFLINHQI